MFTGFPWDFYWIESGFQREFAIYVPLGVINAGITMEDNELQKLGEGTPTNLLMMGLFL